MELAQQELLIGGRWTGAAVSTERAIVDKSLIDSFSSKPAERDHGSRAGAGISDLSTR